MRAGLTSGFPCAEERAGRIGRCPDAGRSGEQDIGKTDLPQQQEMVPDRDRTADSLRPGFGARCEILRQLLLQHNIGECEPAPGLQDAKDLGEQHLLVRREVDDAVRYDRIEQIAAEGKDLGIQLLDFGLRDARLPEVLPCFHDHRFGQVDAVHSTRRTGQVCRYIQVEAGAAADVENNGTGMDRAERKGVSYSAIGGEETRTGCLNKGGIIAEREGSLSARRVGEFTRGRAGHFGVLGPDRIPDLFRLRPLLPAPPGAA